jgi:tetratricopeptide (TPR) repeat protein
MSQVTPSPVQPRRRAGVRHALFGVIALALVCLLAWWGWSSWSRHRMQLAIEANNRGVGYMEYFEEKVPAEGVIGYVKAGKEFEEVVRLMPDWRPGKINLGIALLNSGNKNPADLDRSAAIFEAILHEDPKDPYANYCLGILNQHRKYQSAADYFRVVTEVDPGDPHAWAFQAQTTPNDLEAQLKYYRKAVELCPTLSMAIYGLSQVYNQLAGQAEEAKNPAEKKRLEEQAAKLLAEFEALKAAQWETPSGIKYTEMGKYATVIDTRPPGVPAPPTGPLPLFLPEKKFEVQLAAGARWAQKEDLGTDVVGELRRAVRERFGATIVVVDYDRDGKPDLFLAGAVVENGQVRDLLLHNEGNGVFKDVTAAAGLATPHPTLGCTVGDFDNDGFPDLLLTGAGSQRLFRNKRDGSFEDVTKQAGFDKLTSVCLGAIFVDLDQDGDLDLLIAEYATNADEALKVLKAEKSTQGGVVAYLNVGVAPAVQPTENKPPLDCRWKRADDLKELQGEGGPAVALATSDLDGDNDLDYLTLTDRTSPAVVVNNRLLRFKRTVLPRDVAGDLPWNGALVLDVDQDGRSDLLLLGVGNTPRLLLNRCETPKKDPQTWFEPGVLKSPPLIQAQAVDVDLDGWPDVIGLSDKHIPVLLHNLGGKLIEHANAFGLDDRWPPDLIAVTAVAPKIGPPVSKTTTCNAFPDLLVWSESKGLLLYSNQGNPNYGLLVELNGQIRVFQLPARCNADGVGTWVVAQAGALRSGVENTTLSAGLCQSRQPLVLGLGLRAKAEVVRLRWPDNVFQAELGPDCGDLRIVENNRKGTSCPILFAWNGERFEFVTDFLGAGSMGELGGDGTTRPPRPEESVKIEARQLALKDGHYVVQIAEPMDEITYLDRLQLVAIDHPADVRVYPDERFVAEGPQPSQDLIAFAKEVYPLSAHDHKGRDVTETLRAWDRKTVDGFAKRSWIGFAEEHFVELDFCDRLKGVKPGERVFLCLAGWTDYPYPESIYAAEQAGVAMLPPVLERRSADGQWVKIADAGFPAGLPRMMLLDVTGKLAVPDCRLRLRTNLQIYWDQIFIAVGCHTIPTDQEPVGLGKSPAQSALATSLEVSDAKLEPCGLLKEFSPDGKPPTVFDHDRTESVPFAGLSGNLTRYGDVTELLDQRDDCFVIFGANDLLTVRFDAKKLPALPEGWQRSFVLRTWGYCKDTSIFTAHGSTVGPLPFQKMAAYPYGPQEHYPDDEAHREYQRKYNTRAVRAETFPVRSK